MIGEQHHLRMCIGVEVLHDTIDVFGIKRFQAFPVKGENGEVVSQDVVNGSGSGVPDIQIEGAIPGGDSESHVFQGVFEEIGDAIHVLGGGGNIHLPTNRPSKRTIFLD